VAAAAQREEEAGINNVLAPSPIPDRQSPLLASFVQTCHMTRRKQECRMGGFTSCINSFFRKQKRTGINNWPVELYYKSLYQQLFYV
jgi:hypothetical protein